MKKILIAAAVVGAFAGTAQAQSSVTLYGVADIGLRFDRTSVEGTLRSVETGDMAGNRWGMRGTEDLGGGLKANFMLEAGYNVDTGTTLANVAALATPVGIFTRSSWLGLSGGFGEVRLGLDYSPHFMVWSGIDVFGAASIGTVGGKGVIPTATSAVIGSAAAPLVGGSTRMTNSIYYNSPSFGGFKLLSAYKFGEGNTAATKSVGDVYSLAGMYDNGPLKLGISNYYVKTTAAVRQKDIVIGGSYDFKIVRLHVLGFSSKNNSGAALYSTNGRTYSVGVAVPVGAWTFKAQVARYDDRTVGNADANGVGLGVDYAMSRRTFAYGRYARLNNNATGQNIIGGGLQSATNVALGTSPNALTIGLRHNF